MAMRPGDPLPDVRRTGATGDRGTMTRGFRAALVLVLVFVASRGDAAEVRLGVALGLSAAGPAPTAIVQTQQTSPQLALSGVLELALSDRLSLALRPRHRREAVTRHVRAVSRELVQPIEFDAELKAQRVDVPLLVSWRLGDRKLKPYLVGGPVLSRQYDAETILVPDGSRFSEPGLQETEMLVEGGLGVCWLSGRHRVFGEATYLRSFQESAAGRHRGFLFQVGWAIGLPR